MAMRFLKDNYLYELRHKQGKSERMRWDGFVSQHLRSRTAQCLRRNKLNVRTDMWNGS